ncbi:zinc finger MYM-type protein 1-like protein [Tanacetum coccineum]
MTYQIWLLAKFGGPDRTTSVDACHQYDEEIQTPKVFYCDGSLVFGTSGLIMAKYKTLESYFKRKSEDASGIANQENKHSRVSTDEPEQHQNQPHARQHQNQPEALIPETHKQTTEETGSGDLERDPAKRKAMWDYSVNEREQVRRAYLHLGPYQIHLKEYPVKGRIKHPRRFQYSWFKVFPDWNDESSNSRNRGNFVELLKLLASYNDELANLVLDNAPYNSKYTSGKIQKEILGIIAKEVRKRICNEVGDSYFFVMVDESRDESKKEQMAIVLRFVNTNSRKIFVFGSS